MYFHKLNKKEIEEIKDTISEANKRGFLSGVDFKVRDHVTNCKICEKELNIYCHNATDVILSKKLMRLGDDITYKIEKHSGFIMDRHCSLEYIRKQCICLQHELVENHCCDCEPEKCIKKKQ